MELLAILRKGHPDKIAGKVEAAVGLAELARWRTRTEGRISELKRAGGSNTGGDGQDAQP